MRLGKRLRQVGSIAIIGLLLAACASQPAPKFPELTYTHLAPINLGVADIQIINNAGPATDANRVDNRMPVSPSTALSAWARDRLKANGVSGTAFFTIEEASVVEVPLPRTSGITGAFTKDQAQRYDLKVRATLRLEGVPRVTQAFADSLVSRSQTVTEDVSLNERNQILFDLTETAMKDFDPAMEASIRQHLGAFVR